MALYQILSSNFSSLVYLLTNCASTVKTPQSFQTALHLFEILMLYLTRALLWDSLPAYMCAIAVPHELMNALKAHLCT